MKKVLFIRADAGARIGLGHVMRCLALAQAWQDAGGSAVFAMGTGGEAIAERLRPEQVDVQTLAAEAGSLRDAQATAEQAVAAGAEWRVVDGYHFGGDYQRLLKESRLRVLCVDDTGALDHYWADLVLNQNLHADESLYQRREPYTELLLGTRYTLLRREFLGWRDWKRELPPTARRLLVTLGGGDPENVTLKVLHALDRLGLPDLEAVGVLGENNPHRDSLEAAAANSSVRIELKRGATDMSDLMASADAAVSGGGSTCWEMAFMGVPSVVVGLADNQRGIAEGLARYGSVLNLGWHGELSHAAISRALNTVLFDAELRYRMSMLSSQLVDSGGAKRVLKAVVAVAEGDRQPAGITPQ